MEETGVSLPVHNIFSNTIFKKLEIRSSTFNVKSKNIVLTVGFLSFFERRLRVCNHSFRRLLTSLSKWLKIVFVEVLTILRSPVFDAASNASFGLSGNLLKKVSLYLFEIFPE